MEKHLNGKYEKGAESYFQEEAIWGELRRQKRQRKQAEVFIQEEPSKSLCETQNLVLSTQERTTPAPSSDTKEKRVPVFRKAFQLKTLNY